MTSQKPKANSKTTKASYAMPQVQQERLKSQNLDMFHVLGTLPSNQSKQTFAQKGSSSQSQQYVAKAYVMKVQVLKHFHLSNSRKLGISKKNSHGKYFIQDNLVKTCKFYEFILVDIDLVQISHIQNQNSIDICYSKCKICKVLCQKMWGQSLNTHKIFSQNFRSKS